MQLLAGEDEDDLTPTGDMLSRGAAVEWPPRPDFAPLNALTRKALLGEFEFRAAPTADNAEAVQILGDWEEKNIVSLVIPQLVGIKAVRTDGKVRLHRLAVAPFLRFFEEIEKAGLLDRVLQFGGSFARRFSRGSTKFLSNHAYGTAIDINVPWNGLAAVPAQKGQRGCVRELVPIAHELGIYWGGHFRRMDGMHFELARVEGGSA
jgi:hypothetical protein